MLQDKTGTSLESLIQFFAPKSAPHITGYETIITYTQKALTVWHLFFGLVNFYRR